MSNKNPQFMNNKTDNDNNPCNDDNENNTKNHQQSINHNEWSDHSLLGPHTGWVKDVIYDDANELIYSIGCNCIEIWSLNKYDIGNNEDDTKITTRNNQNQKNTHRTWNHKCKLMIDSCKEKGSTLSSDLLCLCLVSNNNNDDDEKAIRSNSIFSSTKNYLLAGGVDGRIHSWSITNRRKGSNDISITNHSMHHPHDATATATATSKPKKSSFLDIHIEPISNIKAHAGRVNKMILCNDMKMLVSIGNDGAIQCRDLSNHLTSSLLDDDSKNDNIRIKASTNKSMRALDALDAVNVIFDGERFSLCAACDNTDNQNGVAREKNYDSSHTPFVRLSSIYCIHEDSEKSIVAVGTSSGFVFLAKIRRLAPRSSSSPKDGLDSKPKHLGSTMNMNSSRSSIIIEIMEDHVLSLQNSPTVHDLANVLCRTSQLDEENSQESQDKNKENTMTHTIIIGHSNGLTLWNTWI